MKARPPISSRRRSRLRRAALAAAVVGLMGCTGLGDPPPPPLLAYAEPDPNPVNYAFSDTTVFEIRAPGYGTMDVETGRRGTAELNFSGGVDGLRVHVRFTELEGRFRGGDRRTDPISAGDVGGAIGVEISPRGNIAVVDTPAVSPALLDVVGVESLVRPFFVNLPARPMEPGMRWTDTVVAREAGAGSVSRATSVIVSTLAGDTVLNGRRLLRIETRAETAVEVSGVSGGVDIEQHLSGTLLGAILWDPDAHLLVARTEAGSLSGSLLMPGTSAVSLPVSAAIRRSVAFSGATSDP